MAVVLPAMTSAVFPCLGSLAGGAQALPYSEWAVFWRHRSQSKHFCCFSTFHVLIFLPNILSFKTSGSRSQLEAASWPWLRPYFAMGSAGHWGAARRTRERGVPAASCMGKGVPRGAALGLGGLAQSRQAMWSDSGCSVWSCRVRRAQPLLSVCQLCILKLGFCQQNLSGRNLPGSLGKQGRLFFFFSLPSSPRVFALLGNICAKPQEAPADENHPASAYRAEAGDRPEEARNKFDKEQVAWQLKKAACLQERLQWQALKMIICNKTAYNLTTLSLLV